MYGNPLADLSEAAMRRLQIIETKEAEIAIRRLSGDSEFGGVQVPAGMEKQGEVRRGSISVERGGS